MAEEKPKPQQIKIADNIAGAEYSNIAQINHTQEEFQMMFMNVLPPSGKVVAKVIITPGHFKRMIAAMQENLKKYEDRFGEVKTAPSVNSSEIGFKG
jgi:hypothetical protein